MRVEDVNEAIFQAIEQHALSPDAIELRRALFHNPPVLTPYFKLEHAAREARQYLGEDPGPFSRIFLLAAITPGAEVVRVYP